MTQKKHELYKNLFSTNELFLQGSNGIQTKRDDLFVDFDLNQLSSRIKRLLSNDLDNNFIENYKIEDSSSYPLLRRISSSVYSENFISDVLYRPLDYRKIYYDKDLLGRPFYKTQKHLYQKQNNFCLILGRQGLAVGPGEWNLVSISNVILDTNLFYRGGNMAFPLYLYDENETQYSTNEQDRTPNLNPAIVDKISKILSLNFVPEKENNKTSFAPIDLLDYIYAILHSPTYREKYKEFLKIDFPRVPYPTDATKFWQLVKLGGELRQIHLLESEVVEKRITAYNIPGDNKVEKPNYKDGKVYINEAQYFDNVPEVAWNFYIGGYQPAQKWLKDRKGRELGYEDVSHYQKIIVALMETDRIMKEIDKIEI